MRNAFADLCALVIGPVEGNAQASAGTFAGNGAEIAVHDAQKREGRARDRRDGHGAERAGSLGPLLTSPDEVNIHVNVGP